MATNTDKIDELTRLVAVLTERLDNVRNEVQSLDKEQDGTDERLVTLGNRLILVEERVSELKRASDETAKRGWAFWHLVLSAILGASLTLIVQFILQVSMRQLFPAQGR